jgi:hypothetical protein
MKADSCKAQGVPPHSTGIVRPAVTASGLPRAFSEVEPEPVGRQNRGRPFPPHPMATRNPYFSASTAQARFDAWWQGDTLDRPPVTLSVSRKRGPAAVHSAHRDLRERWLDVDYQVNRAIAAMEDTAWMGDRVPSWMPNLGPDLVATLFGAELIFGETTSWCQPCLEGPDTWQTFMATPPDFGSVYWRTIETMIDRAAERFAGRFAVAMPDLHGNFDVLAGLRGPEQLCLDVVDDTEEVRRAGLHASRGYTEAFRRLHRRLTALDQPGTTWCPYLHRGPAYVPSCDFWCLVSADVAETLIVPCIEMEMATLERTIFHLDGPGALHHLDTVLRLPRLNAVQWVYGAGNGPARRWLPVYERIRDAGRSVQVLAEDGDDALAVLEALGPAGLWLDVAEPFAHAGRVEEFLDAVHRRSA